MRRPQRVMVVVNVLTQRSVQRIRGYGRHSRRVVCWRQGAHHLKIDSAAPRRWSRRRGVKCGVDSLVGGSKLAGEMTAISTLHLGASVQYRVVSEMPPSDDAPGRCAGCGADA